MGWIQRIIDIEKPERALGGLSVEYSPCDDIQRDASIILTNMKKVDWQSLSLDQKLEENGFTKIERATKDIDANWIGIPPAMSALTNCLG